VNYAETMAYGTGQYRPVIDGLRDAGLPAQFVQTGGMCAALEVRLETGHVLIVTEADDSLSWDWAHHHSWGVGAYTAKSYENSFSDQLGYVESENGDLPTLIKLIEQLIGDLIQSAS